MPQHSAVLTNPAIRVADHRAPRTPQRTGLGVTPLLVGAVAVLLFLAWTASWTVGGAGLTTSSTCAAFLQAGDSARSVAVGDPSLLVDVDRLCTQVPATTLGETIARARP